MIPNRIRARCASGALAAVAVAFGGPGPTTAQEADVAQDRTRILEVARSIMTGARYCSLITIDSDGRAQARAMDAFAPDEDFVVWMGTRPDTRKVAQIRREPRVTLYYFDPASMGYVTLAGTARIVADAAEKARRWKDAWDAFYQDRDEGYVLIEVTPRWLEVVSEADGVTGDPGSWRPPRVEFGDSGS